MDGPAGWATDQEPSASAVADGTGVLGATLTHLRGERLRQFDLGSSAAADEAVAALPSDWFVSRISRKRRQVGPAAPYNTASLQQDASRKLGYSVGEVMRLAQRLYEGVEIADERVALITYMRTDGVQISPDAISAIRDHVATAFGADEQWLPPKPRARQVIPVTKPSLPNSFDTNDLVRLSFRTNSQ